jgi:hypothetical protein
MQDGTSIDCSYGKLCCFQGMDEITPDRGVFLNGSLLRRVVDTRLMVSVGRWDGGALRR